jgi:preprotein translocase subunit Sec63
MDSLDSGEVLVMILAGVIGFVIIWYVMGQITEKFSTGGEPAQQPAQQPSRPEWADVLGVAPDATRDDIKRAYLRKIEEFEPGRLATLGPEMRKLAEERLQQINLAFNAAERRFTGR